MAGQAKIGVVGTSWWSELIYLPILQQYERAHLAAVCGRNQDQAARVAAKYGIAEVYSDYRRMFADADLDGVILATPDDTHYEIALAAFDAGLHVLCEKPAALNADQVLEMLKKGEERGLKHMVMFTHHWFPYLQRLKALLAENYIGKVFHGNFHWFGNYALDGHYLWRFDGSRSKGILGDLGSHLIHMTQWFFGDVKTVTGQLGFHVARQGPDGSAAHQANDTTQFLLEFENGAQIQFYTSAAAHVIDANMRLSICLYGEKGTIEAQWRYTGDESTTLLVGQQAGTDEKIHEVGRADFGEFFSSNPVGARLFVDCILDGKPMSPGLKEGYEVQKVIDAVIQSHETNCRLAMV